MRKRSCLYKRCTYCAGLIARLLTADISDIVFQPYVLPRLGLQRPCYRAGALAYTLINIPLLMQT